MNINNIDSSHQARIDLAACFRWAARLDMHEAIANHFSFAISEDGKKFCVTLAVVTLAI